jgi:hypothetical protein
VIGQIYFVLLNNNSKKGNAMQFREFVLNENKAYLGQRIGDILNALQDMEENKEGLGARQMVTDAERIVNQIRRILHTNWPQDQQKNLEALQKSGVGIMRAIEDKDDLSNVLPTVTQEIEKLMGDMGTPVQQLATPEGAESAEEAPETISPSAGETPPEAPPEEPTPEPTEPPPGTTPPPAPPVEPTPQPMV